MKNSTLDPKGKEEPRPMHNVCYLIDFFLQVLIEEVCSQNLERKNSSRKYLEKNIEEDEYLNEEEKGMTYFHP